MRENKKKVVKYIFRDLHEEENNSVIIHEEKSQL